MDVRRIPADSDEALWLVGQMVAGLWELYPKQDDDLPTTTVEDFSPPGGGFVGVYEDGRPIAGGGIRRLDEGVGEVKRMYVVAELRGRGVARLLLGALEDLARDLGYTRVRLDTGAEQPHARALYASAGYFEIDDYNGNPYASYWGEKRL
ncbi:MAG: GNAT family N-acetyltransferase [Solirubrobacteraceae bacterium]